MFTLSTTFRGINVNETNIFILFTSKSVTDPENRVLGDILSEAVLNIKCEKMQGKQNWEEIAWLCTARTGLSGTAKQTYSFYFCIGVSVFLLTRIRGKEPFVLTKACDTFY